MSRFIPHRDMTADEIMKCSYQAQALIALCSRVADQVFNNEHAARIGGDISTALDLAYELVGLMSEALEGHEGLKGGEA